jgi:hypothetical protein
VSIVCVGGVCVRERERERERRREGGKEGGNACEFVCVCAFYLGNKIGL